MLYDRNCRQGPASDTGAAPKKEMSNGLSWWGLKRDLSTASSARTSIMSTSSPREGRQHPLVEDDSPSSANRLLFDGASSSDSAAPQQQFATQEKPKRREDSNYHHRLQWTRGSRDTEGPSPEEQRQDEHDSSNDSARRRRPERDLLGSSSGKLKSLKLAPTSSATGSSNNSGERSAGTDRPDTPGVGGGEGDSPRTLGAPRVCRQEETEHQPRQVGACRRTPSKPPRPQQQCHTAETRGRVKGNGGGSNRERRDGETAVGGGVGAGETTSDRWGCKAYMAGVDEGMDDETAVAVNTAKEPSVVYDILAVDRGSGYCDTSVVPFPVKEGGEVAAERMRALTSGQGDFLARRWAENIGVTEISDLVLRSS